MFRSSYTIPRSHGQVLPVPGPSFIIIITHQLFDGVWNKIKCNGMTAILRVHLFPPVTVPGTLLEHHFLHMKSQHGPSQ